MSNALKFHETAEEKRVKEGNPVIHFVNSNIQYGSMRLAEHVVSNVVIVLFSSLMFNWLTVSKLKSWLSLILLHQNSLYQ